MGLETVTHLDDLNVSNPVSGDGLDETDNHLRNIKLALKTDLPNVNGPVNFTPTEANVLAGVTPGTAAASKAVVLDASSKIDVLDMTAWKIGGVAVTSIAAELNILDGVTATKDELNILDGVTADKDELNYNDIAAAGAAEASKAVVLDASKDISGLGAVGASGFTATSTDAGSSVGPVISLKRDSASPADNDWIGGVEFVGEDDASNETTYARIIAQILDVTDTSEGAELQFYTTRAGAHAERAYVGNGFVVGNPTGGDKGAGTINAVAVYDDNSLLTCYVFDAALDGDIDEEKWNDKAPDHVDEHGSVTKRDHEPMKKFKGLLHGIHDPLDIDKYALHWKVKRHLSSLPDEKKFDIEKGMPMGSWIQQLVETVEIQAVLIEELNQRLKALEA